MAQTVVNRTDTFEQWRIKNNQMGQDIGDLSALTTPAANIVAAVNNVATTADNNALALVIALGG